MKKKHNRLKLVLSILLCLVLVMMMVFNMYVSDYYHADGAAAEAMESRSVDVVNAEDGTVSFFPSEKTDTGMIFYPGGKVEYTAYAPLMEAYAEQGIGCVLVRMPYNLAVFGINRADDIADKYPDIKHWYIGGHSLGGAMAAVYAYRHADDLDGLVLLGAYSTKDLSDTDLTVVLIDGSNDQVINKEKAEESEKNYPDKTYEFTIEGGNHSQFGSYGLQKGDGRASVSGEEQWQETAADTAEVIRK